MRAGAAHACGLENSAAFVLRSYGVLSKARAAARHTRRLGGGLRLTEAELSPWGESGRGRGEAVVLSSNERQYKTEGTFAFVHESWQVCRLMTSLTCPARLFLSSRLQLGSSSPPGSSYVLERLNLHILNYPN